MNEASAEPYSRTLTAPLMPTTSNSVSNMLASQTLRVSPRGPKYASSPRQTSMTARRSTPSHTISGT
jgi:hypothetical protein